MMDSLSIHAKADTPFAGSFRRLQVAATEPHLRGKVLKIESGRGYQTVWDLRAFGIPLSVSLNNQWQDGGGKLTYYETSKLDISAMRDLYYQVFDGEFCAHRVLRIDVNADVSVPVPWFRQNVYVRSKGYLDYQREVYERHVFLRQAETGYAGKKPNQWRIYDKGAERWMALKKENNRRDVKDRLDDDELDALFQELYARHPDEVWTRVERQMGGYDPGKNKIHLVDDLQRLPKFDPFSQLVFSEVKQHQRLEGLPVTWEHHVLAMREMVRVDGLDMAKAYLRCRIGHGPNASRHWKKLEPFLRGICSEGIDHNTLRAVYVAGIERQLGMAASCSDERQYGLTA
jgi:hypothetical protein